MICHKKLNVIKLDNQLTQAVLKVQQGLYKSFYTAAKALQLNSKTILNHVNEGLLCSQACQQQQKLLSAQKNVLLK